MVTSGGNILIYDIYFKWQITAFYLVPYQRLYLLMSFDDVIQWHHKPYAISKGEWLSLLASTSKRDKCKYGGTSAHLLAVDECHEFPRIELIDGPQESNMVGIPLTESFASDDAFQTPPPQCGSVLRHGTSHQSH